MADPIYLSLNKVFVLGSCHAMKIKEIICLGGRWDSWKKNF